MRKQRGYTEPDPRDDLSGIDVARKLIILGREMGLKLEIARRGGRKPGAAGPGRRAAARNSCAAAELDAAMRERFEAAQARGKVLRYVGAVNARAARRPSAWSSSIAKHAFANIALTDNVVRFVTGRYCDNPLIVQGPGAGPAVTAGGVFADLLRLAAYLGARHCERRAGDRRRAPRRSRPPRSAMSRSASTSSASPSMRSAIE